MSNIERIKALYVKFDEHVSNKEYSDAQSVICLINDITCLSENDTVEDG